MFVLLHSQQGARSGQQVDGARCRTSMRDVWAIGDLVGEPMLAHKASAQGEMVSEIIAGARRQFDPVAIPAVCFTEPEIVSVGLGPEDASKRGIDMIVAQFPFAANVRALSMEAGEAGGFVRVVAAATIIACSASRQSARTFLKWSGNSFWQSRWEPCSRTWPERSTPTRP